MLVHKPPISEFLEVVKRSLGAKDVRLLNGDEAPYSGSEALVCELPAGQLLAVSFAEAVANQDSARRRLEMLVRAFSSTLATAAGETPPDVPKARALNDELAALVERAGAIDAVVIDANSPVVWGGASCDLGEMVDEDGEREPDNVIRIDRQSAAARRSELVDRARELGVRMFEALAIDPRAMTLVPREICEKHRVIPLFGGGSGLLLAMADATDVQAIHDTVLASGLEVEPGLANERLIQFVLAWNQGGDARSLGDVIGALDPDQRALREALAATIKNRWTRHYAVRKAIHVVHAMPEMTTLYRGGHLNRSVIEPDFALIARSFAGIYVLIVVFSGPFEELRAKHAVTHALPAIESLVLALPPRDPPPSIAGAKAMRRPAPR
jgi:hypothetical protein